MKKLLFLLTISAVAISLSCGKKEVNNPADDAKSKDRGVMLTAYVEQYALPAYAAMSVSLDSLTSANTAFANAPSTATLAKLREQYLASYMLWQRVDVAEMGPISVLSLRQIMNTYPVTVSKLESNISTGTYDLESFENRSVQGFPAMDYLLHSGASDAAIIAQYTTDANADKRKRYLVDIVNHMQKKLAETRATWQKEKASFVALTGNDVNSGTSALANGFVLYYERFFRAGKIGLPVGAMTGVAATQLTESYYSTQHSKALAAAALQAFQDYYEGKSFDGKTTMAMSLKKYLANAGIKNESGTLTADVISTKINTAKASLNNLDANLITAIQTNRTAVIAVYQQFQEIVPLIKVDLISALGISITYTDNDGD